MQRLRATLERIYRKGYAAYRDLSGSHDFGSFTLTVDRVQRDPFAPPSLIRVRTKENAFDSDLFENPVRRIAFEDFLTRSVERAIRRVVRGNRGSGGSGRVEIQRTSQIVLPRTSMVAAPDYAEARMAVGLPARGRSVDARAAKTVLLEELPEVVRRSLFPAPQGGVDRENARLHVEAVEDANFLRGRLPELGLMAFVADGAVLPRESGASDRPLGDGAVPFMSSEEYRVEVDLPNRGTISGMGVPGGITLVAGGGFHGKSTLLLALSWGVYDHVPRDGRVGDYLDVADRVILLEDYRPSNATARSREVTEKFPPRAPLAPREVHPPHERVIDPSSVDLRRGKRQAARGRGLQAIELGRERVDLSYIEQLAEAGQTEAVARIIGEWAAAGEVRKLRDLLTEAITSVSENGLDSLGSFRGHPGEMSLPRAQELAATITRVRPLRASPNA